MARIRTVKPTFFTSLDIARLPSDSVRLYFIGLWTHADDAGRGIDDVRLIKAALAPLDDSKTLHRMEKIMEALAKEGRILRYEVDGQRYFQVLGWPHQRIDKPQPSRFPPPPGPDPFSDHSTNGAGTIVEGSCLDRRGKEKEGNGIGKESSSSSTSDPRPPPTRPAGDGAPAEEESPSIEATIVATVALLADKHLQAALDRGDTVRSQPGWLDEDRHRTVTAVHDQAVATLGRHPDLTPFELAVVLEGGALPIRYRRSMTPEYGAGPTDSGRTGAADARQTLTNTRRRRRQ